MLDNATNNEDHEKCGRPCSPETCCDSCVAYWERMISEGYWDEEHHRWTDKGWSLITKSF